VTPILRVTLGDIRECPARAEVLNEIVPTLGETSDGRSLFIDLLGNKAVKECGELRLWRLLAPWHQAMLCQFLV
jgi:hypothetical protein